MSLDEKFDFSKILDEYFPVKEYDFYGHKLVFDERKKKYSTLKNNISVDDPDRTSLAILVDVTYIDNKKAFNSIDDINNMQTELLIEIMKLYAEHNEKYGLKAIKKS